jgi:hypothetical protein
MRILKNLLLASMLGMAILALPSPATAVETECGDIETACNELNPNGYQHVRYCGDGWHMFTCCPGPNDNCGAADFCCDDVPCAGPPPPGAPYCF